METGQCHILQPEGQVCVMFYISLPSIEAILNLKKASFLWFEYAIVLLKRQWLKFQTLLFFLEPSSAHCAWCVDQKSGLSVGCIGTLFYQFITQHVSPGYWHPDTRNVLFMLQNSLKNWNRCNSSQNRIHDNPLPTFLACIWIFFSSFLFKERGHSTLLLCYVFTLSMQKENREGYHWRMDHSTDNIIARKQVWALTLNLLGSGKGCILLKSILILLCSPLLK